jgi:hypothetical protein
LPEGAERTAAVAAWFQELYATGDEVPVLVGGAAAVLYTAGLYSTGDLDFVGTMPAEVERRLVACGFSRQGRYWVFAPGELFLELPAAHLDPEEQAARIRIGKWTVLALSPEDLLVDRLAAWQFWSSETDAVGAFLIRRGVGKGIDDNRLRDAARRRGVEPALARLAALDRQLGTKQPSTEELREWARRVP